jgi:hypothetical protein
VVLTVALFQIEIRGKVTRLFSVLLLLALSKMFLSQKHNNYYYSFSAADGKVLKKIDIFLLLKHFNVNLRFIGGP